MSRESLLFSINKLNTLERHRVELLPDINAQAWEGVALHTALLQLPIESCHKARPPETHKALQVEAIKPDGENIPHQCKQSIVERKSLSSHGQGVACVNVADLAAGPGKV